MTNLVDEMSSALSSTQHDLLPHLVFLVHIVGYTHRCYWRRSLQLFGEILREYITNVPELLRDGSYHVLGDIPTMLSNHGPHSRTGQTSLTAMTAAFHHDLS
jgi:hypothetical protein